MKKLFTNSVINMNEEGWFQIFMQQIIGYLLTLLTIHNFNPDTPWNSLIFSCSTARLTLFISQYIQPLKEVWYAIILMCILIGLIGRVLSYCHQLL